MLIALLKSIIILILNTSIGILFVIVFRAFFFFPRKSLFWRGKQIPYTPGLLYRKKDWLIEKISSELHKYLQSAFDLNDTKSKIYQWQEEAYKKSWDKFAFLEKYKYIPYFISSNLRHLFSQFTYEFVKQFFRSFVPFLIEKYRAESYIDLLSEKLDIDIIYEYYNKYIFKYMMIFVGGWFFLTGLLNMIFFWIVY